MKALYRLKWSLAFFAAYFAFASSGILRAADDLPLPPGVIARLGDHRFVHAGAIRFISFIAGDQRIFSRSSDGISIWEIASGRRVFEDRGKIHRTLTNARISQDGQLIFWAASGPEIGLVNLAVPEKTRWFEGAVGRSFSLAMTPDARWGVSSDRGKIHLWDFESGKIKRRFEAARGSVRAAAITNDGRFVAAGGADSPIRVWDARDGRLLHAWTGSPGSLCFSADGRKLAATLETRLSENSTSNSLALFDVNGGQRVWGFPGEFNTVAFSPDGARLAVGGLEEIIILDATSGGEIHRLKIAGNLNVNAVAFSNDGKLLATGGEDDRIRLWQTADWSEMHAGSGHAGPVESIAFTPDGGTIATGGRDRTVRLWSWPEGQPRRVIKDVGESWGVPALTFSDDGRRLAAYAQVSNGGDPISVWDAGSSERSALLGKRAVLAALAFLPGGRQLLTGFPDGEGHGTIGEWDIASGKLVRRIGRQRGWIHRLFLLPGGQQVVWMGENQGLGIRDLASGEEVRIFKGGSHHSDGHLAVAPDGSWLAEGFHAWDAESGEKISKDLGIGSGMAAAISPDGRMLAWAGVDGIHLWEHLLRREIHVITAAVGKIHALAFSPDGTALASAGNDGGVLLWDMTGGVPPAKPAEFDTLWTDLGGDNHWRAHASAWKLARAGHAAVEFVAQKLVPAKPLDERELADLRGKFKDPDLAARDTAARILIDRGLSLSAAEWRALRRPDPHWGIGNAISFDALSGRPILRREPDVPLPDSALLPPPEFTPLPERLRASRAIKALEFSSDAAAKSVLEVLASGEATDPQTREARRALAAVTEKARRAAENAPVAW